MADQRETQEFLEWLYHYAKQEGEEPHDVAERVYQNARGVSRREALQAGGALGIGALLGGGGGYAATQNAKADPSTSDDDGNVGLPSDRVDVFGDGGDFNSLSADEVDGGVNEQSASITTLRDIGIVDAGQFDASEWDDNALVAERE